MPAKSIRFSELIKTSGKPHVVTLWTEPTKDRALMEATKENRVLTIHQEPTHKKADVAQIGFYKGPHSSYLIFPKPLPENKEARVVGLNYELISEPAVRDPLKVQSPSPRKSAELSRVKKFSITIRRVATIEKQLLVVAKNKKDAEREALRQIDREPFEMSEAVSKTEIRGVE